MTVIWIFGQMAHIADRHETQMAPKSAPKLRRLSSASTTHTRTHTGTQNPQVSPPRPSPRPAASGGAQGPAASAHGHTVCQRTWRMHADAILRSTLCCQTLRPALRASGGENENLLGHQSAKRRSALLDNSRIKVRPSARLSASTDVWLEETLQGRLPRRPRDGDSDRTSLRARSKGYDYDTQITNAEKDRRIAELEAALSSVTCECGTCAYGRTHISQMPNADYCANCGTDTDWQNWKQRG